MRRINFTSKQMRRLFDNRYPLSIPKLNNWLKQEAERLLPFHVAMLEFDDHLLLYAKLIDYKPDDIIISLEPNRVIIKACLSHSARLNSKPLQQDLPEGSLFRVIVLPYSVSITESSASLRENMLIITLKKAAAPRAVTLKVAG